jgi:hypothetical protein
LCVERHCVGCECVACCMLRLCACTSCRWRPLTGDEGADCGVGQFASGCTAAGIGTLLSTRRSLAPSHRSLKLETPTAAPTSMPMPPGALDVGRQADQQVGSTTAAAAPAAPHSPRAQWSVLGPCPWRSRHGRYQRLPRHAGYGPSWASCPRYAGLKGRNSSIQDTTAIAGD